MNGLNFAAAAVKKVALKTAAKTSKEKIPVFAAAKPICMKGGKKGRFSVGFSSADITPTDIKDHAYWMAGYRIAKRIEGVMDPITANAMWIDCGDGQGMVLLSCDLIGLTGYDVGEIRASLRDFCLITGCKHITISCTHTHAGVDTMGYWGVLPRTGKDKKYMAYLKQTIKELCFKAYKDRRPGKLLYGNTEAPELIERWRQPYFSNNTLHRFRFVPDDGSTETWYINFGAHPNTLGGKNVLLSADYPTYMRREINRAKKTNIMFSISTIGATDIGAVAEKDLDRTLIGGTMLGKKVLSIKKERTLKPDITVISQNFVMPIDNYTLAAANALKIFTAKRCAAESKTGMGLVSELTYIGIDGVEILTMPGETFSELVFPGGYTDAEKSTTGEGPEVNSQPISEIFGNEKLIIFGVTNDMAGYALAPNEFLLHEKQPYLSRATDRFGRNHYHETNSCGIKAGHAMAQTAKIIKMALDDIK